MDTAKTQRPRHPLGPLGVAKPVTGKKRGSSRFRYAVAEASAPSAKPSFQFTRPDSSSFVASRSSAWSKIPLVVHSTKRRQQVGYDGNDLGRSSQRAPVRSTHKTPSNQACESILGRPASKAGGGVGKMSSISPHCLSLSTRGELSDSGSFLDHATTRDRSVIEGLASEPSTDRGDRRFR